MKSKAKFIARTVINGVAIPLLEVLYEYFIFTMLSDADAKFITLLIIPGAIITSLCFLLNYLLNKLRLYFFQRVKAIFLLY